MIDHPMRVLLAPGLARLCCALLCLGIAAPALAEKADRDKPINFQGDTGGGNAESKNGELSGNVVVTQGTLSIHADRITFHQNPDNSLSAIAYGNPVTFREKRDGVDEYYEGFAQRIVYDGQKRFVELFDNALLKKGKRPDPQQLHFLRRGNRGLQGRRPPGQRTRRDRRSTARGAGSRRVPAGIEGRQGCQGSEGRQECQGRG